MKARAFDLRRLDVERFARESGHLEGQLPLAAFDRLQALLDADSAFVEWRADGERRAVAGTDANVGLRLQASATASLLCQRCLAPVDVPLNIERRFRFARDEAAAEALDAEIEDDVLALTHALDLHALLEDELLLGLPLVPRHERCPDGSVAPAADDDESESAPGPFAALAALKKGERRG